MSITKLVVEATIPTVQYGNIKPQVEVEGEDFATIRDEALQALKSISDMTAGDGYAFEVRGLPVAQGRTTLKVEDKEIDYTSVLLGKTTKVKENDGHKYIPGYLGGSSFPSRFYAPFDSQAILEAIVNKFNVKANDVKAIWDLNNSASTGYGTAIHAVLENYMKNRELGNAIRSVEKKATKANPVDTLSPNKAFSKNPFLKHIVESFLVHIDDKAKYLTEEFIWDDDFKFNGSMDLLKIVDQDKKIVRIQDYKTDGNIHEKKYQLTTSPFYKLTQGDAPKLGKELLDLHWLQLSFYAFILQRAGWTVEGLDVFWLNPEKLVKGENPWEVFSRDVLDITEGL